MVLPLWGIFPQLHVFECSCLDYHLSQSHIVACLGFVWVKRVYYIIYSFERKHKRSQIGISAGYANLSRIPIFRKIFLRYQFSEKLIF